MKKAVTLPFYAKLTLVLLGIILSVYIGIIGKGIIIPMFIAFLISMLLLPVTRFQENKLRFPRIVACLVSPILFLGMVLGVGYFLGTQVVQFKDDIPEFRDQIVGLFNDAQIYIAEHFDVTEQEQVDYLSKNVEKTFKTGSSLVSGAILSITSVLLNGGFIFLYTFFFLLYRDHLIKFLIWCFGPQQQDKVITVSSSVQGIIKQYLVGLMIQVALITGMLYLAFSIIGIKYAFLFAMLCGILNLIPYIGIFSATVVASLVTLATGELIQVLYLIIAIIVVNSIDGNIIMPKVIGSKVQVNSFMVFVGLIVAESIWGIAGMFLAIPILAIVKIICDEVKDLKPVGFLLGEEEEVRPIFEKYYKKYFYNQQEENQTNEEDLADSEHSDEEQEEDNNQEENKP
ncbi:AI-2E family transporter [Avrilella dinanensis]|uniref:AI-2E family transporter n=1 Tax=Avrilella dinanensis TaxID=2008672 RepID=UPI00240A70E4|nr:AI-2E family transporter [Avrilella dinanensis]